MSARMFRRLVPLVVALVLVSCGDSVDDEDDDRTELPNPASVFCEEQGGTVEIVTDASGSQSGICHLPDGTRIEEWEYFRSQGGAG